MNSFKMLFALILVISSTQFLYAAQENCEPLTSVLTCQANYQLESNYAPEIVTGPLASAGVENLEPEPFDPAICNNSVVLFTYAGRFIASYYHRDHSFAAHLYSDGQMTTFSDYEKIDPREVMTFTGKFSVQRNRFKNSFQMYFKRII